MLLFSIVLISKTDLIRKSSRFKERLSFLFFNRPLPVQENLALNTPPSQPKPSPPPPSRVAVIPQPAPLPAVEPRSAIEEKPLPETALQESLEEEKMAAQEESPPEREEPSLISELKKFQLEKEDLPPAPEPPIAAKEPTPTVQHVPPPAPKCEKICPPPPLNLHWNPYPLPKLISVRHVEGTNNGVAYATNYSTLAILSSPDYRPGHFLPMVDLRVHRFDDTSWAANGGLIGRYVPDPCEPASWCRILGMNAYYDWRQGNLGYFQELGGGIEVLGCRWDFRANIYFPFGAKRKIDSCVFDDYEGEYIIIQDKYELVSYAFNGEIGWLAIDTTDFLLYMAGGPYYIAGRQCHNSTRGGQFRLRPQYQDYVALDLSVSYDPLFKTVWEAQVIFHLPLYQIGESSPRGPCGISNRQIYQPVERFEVLPLARYECWNSNF